MLMKTQLTGQKTKFFRSIRDAIYANPFDQTRRVADSAATGLPADTTPAKLLAVEIDLVVKHVQQLQKKKLADINNFSGKERELVTALFLFHVFHRSIDELDKHIRKQNNHFSPQKFTFAVNILERLENYGFSSKDADKYLALFFQMRRAFFFIQKTIIGCSNSMEQLRARLWNNIFTHNLGLYAEQLWERMEDFSTLLLGETGTGKGVVASAIGRSGYIPYDRANTRFTISFTAAFLAINLSQFPEQLIESELFGHKRGAFTGAIHDHQGIFARSSSHGAVFLDEIGDVSTPVQLKLLRILQERTFVPVGGEKEQRFNGRIIGATNRDIGKRRRQGLFRDDFYHRLSSDCIVLPPLRQRIAEDPQELELMAAFLLTRITGSPSKTLLQETTQTMRKSRGASYDWPGNVRELEQCLRSVLLHGAVPDFESVQKSSVGADSLARIIEEGGCSVADLTRQYCKLLYEKHGTYQDVARKTGLDRRTVKKYL